MIVCCLRAVALEWYVPVVVSVGLTSAVWLVSQLCASHASDGMSSLTLVASTVRQRGRCLVGKEQHVVIRPATCRKPKCLCSEYYTSIQSIIQVSYK
jgi:hypothetical protein